MANTNDDALKLWEQMNESERTGVRFGLFPARLFDAKKDNHDLVVALMDIASKNGGMRA